MFSLKHMLNTEDMPNQHVLLNTCLIEDMFWLFRSRILPQRFVTGITVPCVPRLRFSLEAWTSTSRYVLLPGWALCWQTRDEVYAVFAFIGGSAGGGAGLGERSGVPIFSPGRLCRRFQFNAGYDAGESQCNRLR
jgi:hypothetical protein